MELWASRYEDPTGVEPSGLAEASDGSSVYVAGSTGKRGAIRYLTVAYDTFSGSERWSAGYGSGGGHDIASSVAVSRDGSTVFVTGTATGRNSPALCLTVAFDASTGARRWVTKFDVRGTDGAGASIAVSPDGSGVFVAGTIYMEPFEDDFLLLALDASTGARRWWRHSGFGPHDRAGTVVVTPDGLEVILAGVMGSMMGELYYGTVAYSTG